MRNILAFLLSVIFFTVVLIVLTYPMVAFVVWDIGWIFHHSAFLARLYLILMALGAVGVSIKVTGE